MALAEIRGQIQKAKIKSNDSGCQDFMPKGSLSDILTCDKLTDALASPEFSVPVFKRGSTAAEIIERPALKIFAVLVEIKCEKSLLPLMINDYSDSNLPIDRSTLEGILGDGAALFFQLQHEYFVYTFRKGHLHLKLRESQILPYLSQKQIGKGGSSSVYRVLVHHLHQNFVEAQHDDAVPVVRKQLHQNGKAEAELLYLLGSLKHRNIVEILSSYVQSGISNLLFSPADMDLHELLLMPKPPIAFFDDNVYLRALQGLSDGLAYLHNFGLTVKQSEGEAIIMTSSQEMLKHVEDDTKTPWKDSTFEYGSPECRDSETFEPGMVGRALDTWSLGCIISEVAAYMHGGSKSIAAFREQRIQKGNHGTVRCFHDGEKLSLGVSKFLNDMLFTGSSTWLHKLVKLVRRALSAHPNDRPDAKEMKSLLFCFAIEDLTDRVLKMATPGDMDHRPSPSRHEFVARLSFEKSRLLAWADNLGFKSIGLPGKPYHSQVDSLAPQFCEILKSVLDSWAANDRFPNPKENEDYKCQTLRNAIDGLCEHLSVETKVSLDQTLPIVILAESSPLATSLLTTTGVTPGRDSNFGAVVAMKYASILLNQQSLKSSKSYRIESSLLRKLALPQDQVARPDVWLYSYGLEAGEEEKVIVEFIQYWWQELESTLDSREKRAVESMFERMGELVELLRQVPKPTDFLVLDCIGAFHDSQNQRWGLVYAFPGSDNLPVCLNGLLRRGKSCLMIPDLRGKFLLAKKLIACVQSCHTAGWIHKNISSDNVVFFPTTSDLKDMSVDKPYLVGFDHSRPGGSDAYSRGNDSGRAQEYLHPEYRQRSTRARMVHDYYSLGLVLLEIGLWSSISNVYDSHQNLTLSPAQLREKYIALCERDLRIIMGPIYQDVTRKCLQYQDEEDTCDVRLDFQAKVVDHLNTTNV